MSKTFMACLALVAVFAAVASASPIRADLALGAGFGDNCLNKTQKDELRKITDGIKITLNTAVVSLDIAAAAEKDPKTKQNLELAAKIINAVNVELVSNLSKIADEACGTCSQITKAVNDSITALEQALEKIEPDWKKNPIFEDVVKALSDIIGLVEALCPTGACARAQLRLRDSCLNATQLAELKKAIDGIQILIKTADLALLIAARAESDPKTKQDLLTVEKVLSSVSDELLANLTSLLSQPCASCKQVTALVGDFITTIENTLAKIDPDWTKDPLWKEVVDALNQIVSLVEDICPSRVAYAAPLKHMQLHR